MAVIGPTNDHDEIVRWAASQKARPAQVIPYKIDGEPALLRFMFGDMLQTEPELKPIPWEEFFAYFDALGLTFVYETKGHDAPTGQYQLLQIEEKSPYRFMGKPLA